MNLEVTSGRRISWYITWTSRDMLCNFPGCQQPACPPPPDQVPTESLALQVHVFRILTKEVSYSSTIAIERRFVDTSIVLAAAVDNGEWRVGTWQCMCTSTRPHDFPTRNDFGRFSGTRCHALRVSDLTDFWNKVKDEEPKVRRNINRPIIRPLVQEQPCLPLWQQGVENCWTIATVGCATETSHRNAKSFANVKPDCLT